MEITRIKEKNSLHTFKDSTENGEIIGGIKVLESVLKGTKQVGYHIT